MENQSEKKDKNAILTKTTATNLWMRIFVGGFLIYLAYTLGADLKTSAGNELIIFGLATALFGISGVAIMGWSFYRLVKKDYYDPMFDDDEEVIEEASEDDLP